MNDEPKGVCVSFDSVTVRAENYDIAFVRLANMLLDNERFSAGLIDALRGPVADEQSKHEEAARLSVA
jgi:hypothetical protein